MAGEKGLAKKRTVGVLAAVTTPEDIKPTDYIESLNVINDADMDDEEGYDNSDRPTLGNVFAVNIGSITAQNKKYRIHMPFKSGDFSLFRFKFFSPREDVVFYQHDFQNNNYSDPWNVLSAELNLNQPSGHGLVFTPSNTGQYVDVEYTGYNYLDWKLTVELNYAKIVVTQEAIDKSLEGDLVPFQSVSRKNRTYLFSTTRENFPEEIDLDVVAIGNGTLTQITFSGNHNLQVGEVIRLRYVSDGKEFLNGDFIIATVNSSTAVSVIAGPAFGTPMSPFNISGIKVYRNVTTIGEIGVAEKNFDNETWTYTRLIRTTDFNFVRAALFDHPKIEVNSFRTSLYWTDYNDFPRAIYYEGEIQQDGFIATENPEGLYYYDQVDIPTRHNLPLPDAQIEFEELITGGKVPPGNKRYVVRLMLSNLVATDYTEVSNVVSVMASGLNRTYNNRMGNGPDETDSGMAVKLRITHLNPLTHKFMELVVINYVDGAISAERVARKEIDSNEMEFVHTGYEKTVAVDLGSISSLDSYMFDYAQNLTIMDQRAIFSNLKEEKKDDLTDWAKTIKHRIVYSGLFESRRFAGAQWLGEYEKPENIFYRLAFMINETRRFGVRLRNSKTRKRTDVFYVDDIRVDAALTNSGNPNDNRRDQTGPDLLPDQDLTEPTGNGDQRRVRVPHVEFFGFDLDYLIDGVPLRMKYDQIEFMPAERIPEVICTGWGVFSARIIDEFLLDEGPYTGTEPNAIGVDNSDDKLRIIEYPWLRRGSRWSYSNAPAHSVSNTFPATSPNHTDFLPTTFNYSGNTPNQNDNSRNTMRTEKHFINFYCPETLFNKISIDQLDKGKVKLRVYNSSNHVTTRDWFAKNFGRARSYFEELFAERLQGYTDYPISEMQFVESGEEIEVDDGVYQRKVPGIINHDGNNLTNGANWTRVNDYWVNPKILLLTLDANNAPTLNINVPSFYCQLVVDDNQDRQGEKESTVYQTHNAVFPIPLTSSRIGGKQFYRVYGDTMIQGTYVKNRYQNEEYRTLSGSDWPLLYGGDTYGRAFNKRPGFGGGFKMWTQMTFNSILRYDTDEQFLIKGDTGNMTTWLEETSRYMDQHTYNDSYDFLNNVTSAVAFVNSIGRRRDMLVRRHYSPVKVVDGQQDQYREMRAADFSDLDLTDGPIIHQDEIRGELFTWQERRFSRDFFNTNGVLQTSEGQDVNIQEGGVLVRKGVKLSQYGCQHKFSVIKARSAGGKDMVAWVNLEYGVVVRFGADGTVVISEREKMAEHIRKNFRWVRDKHQPFLDEGIHGVWDERFKEFIWTVRGRREVQQWTLSGPVIFTQTLLGTVVRNDNQQQFSVFERTPDLFRCVSAHVSTANTEPGVGADWRDYWEVIPHSDSEYYSEFTLAFTERRNGFSTLYSHKPTMYVQFGDTFLSPRPGSYMNRLFEHRRGERTTWYDVDGDAQIEDAYRKFVFAMQHDHSKTWIAAHMEASGPPTRMEFTTPTQESYLLDSEWILREGKYLSKIKNDSTGTGNNEADTRTLFGKHLFVKWIVKGGIFCRIGLIQIKAKLRAREPNK